MEEFWQTAEKQKQEKQEQMHENKKGFFWQRCFGENITKRQRHSRSKSLSLKTSLSQSMSFNKKADLQRKPRKNYLSALLGAHNVMHRAIVDIPRSSALGEREIPAQSGR